MTTQNFVTLPRKLVEKALRALECAADLLDEQSSAALARNELRAALTEQVQPAQGELETLRAALIQWHQNMMEVCRDSDGTAYLNHRDTAALLQSNAECVPLSEERISACLARAKGKFGTLTPTDIARELEAEITKGQQ